MVRDLAARALAGETLISITTWLQDNGVPTVSGKEWRTNTVRTMQTRGCGECEFTGARVIGAAVWELIIIEALGCGVSLLDPARRTNRSARRYLLTGRRWSDR